MTKKNIKYIRKWVELLTSGKFKQDQSIGFIINGRGCLGAILIRAILLEEGYKTNFSKNIYKLRDDIFEVIDTFPYEVKRNFLEYSNSNAWSFDKMADYLTKRYL